MEQERAKLASEREALQQKSKKFDDMQQMQGRNPWLYTITNHTHTCIICTLYTIKVTLLI